MTREEFNARFNPNGVWDKAAYEAFQAEKDSKRNAEINRELDAHKMAYKVKDVDGNTFVYAGLSSGFPVYRGAGGQTHIFDMLGLTVIQQYAE